MLKILAPFSGWSSSLAEIPDEVFARAMLGEGAALDPTGNELRAPCDGEVISVAAARHAIALRAPGGAEILVHVGVDTVMLRGEGFEPLVRKGDRVHAGDLLMRFDLDLLARKARSLITPIIITNGERFRISGARLDRRLASGDVLFEVEPLGEAKPGGDEASPAAASAVVSEALVITHAHGLHARPAALVARVAKGLPYDLEVRARGRAANPKSTVALMSLGVHGGDEIVIAGFEPRATAGIAEIARVIRNLDSAPAAAASIPAQAIPVQPTREPADPAHPTGVVASRGFCVGPVHAFEADDIAVDENGAGAGAERDALERALSAVRSRIEQRARSATAAARDVMAAHLELLEDPQLLAAARAAIEAGKGAGFAWRASLRASAAALAATGDPLLAERAADLADLERQVLRQLAGHADQHTPVAAGSILVARDLTPSQLIDIDASKLGGIALIGGGPTSHVAILAATLGVPMLVSVGSALASLRTGAVVILDAESGVLSVAPTAQEVEAARTRVAAGRELRARQLADAQQPCRLASGERIEVFANLAGTPADTRLAMEQGAEGCGLLRTEFLFLDRATAPDEAEQLASYQQVADLLAGRPLVIRTLDIGGDKPIAYLPLPPEDNPALGLRGVRTSLWRPELLDAQLRALLGVQPAARILLPMITDISEIATVRARLESLARERGVQVPLLGAMIETPAAAMLADQIAREVDFLSIGTNDLAQYGLAMDRGHAELAARIDGVHPAVLRLIDATTRGAAVHSRPVAVCGGLASDPEAVPLLLGLGVTELSVVPGQIPRVKALVRALRRDDCRALAQRAMALSTAAEVRTLVRSS
ncbi:MAG TPA: phosphoenolpyruvate--protein phosphotransferase [Steroidobacteraceae bacterium]|nr:phosphoenolpyruvate--protein phosphotransferase [Steroidobacteraceae bacterium]